jgi:hypothetical protein
VRKVEEGGRRKEEGGRKKEEGGRRKEEEKRGPFPIQVPFLLSFLSLFLFLFFPLRLCTFALNSV